MAETSMDPVAWVRKGIEEASPDLWRREPVGPPSCAPLVQPVMALLEGGVQVHCLRDLTRGGLAGAVIEIARAAGVHVALDERAIPVRPDVQGACEMLGLDPLYVANEGRFVASLVPQDAGRALEILRGTALGADARSSGRVEAARDGGLVTMTTTIGASRVVDMLSGE